MKIKLLRIFRVLLCLLLVGLILMFVKIYFLPLNNSENNGKSNSTNYDYSKPVPVSKKVDRHYFDDAVFLGDSLTYGMISNSPINKRNVISCKGATIEDMMEKIKLSGREEEGYVDALSKVKRLNPNKIYIMMGTNGFAWMTKEKIIFDYSRLIDVIVRDNPQAKIYVQSILPVSKNKENSDKRYSNSKINQINYLLMNLAGNKKIYYIDINSLLKNEDGYLSYKYTNKSDGIHVNSDAYKLWFDYLCEHIAQ